MNLNKILVGIFICGIYLLHDCSNNRNKTNLGDSLPQNSDNTQKKKYEHILQLAIEIDSIKINGIPAFYTTKKDLIKKFGQPDSIVNNLKEINAGSMWEKIYWGKSSYMAFSVDVIDLTRNHFNIDRIDLNDEYEITINNMVINKNTTSNDLKILFSENYKLDSIENKKLQDIDNMILSIYVKTNQQLLDDSRIYFSVEKGKVKVLSYSVPSI